MRGSFPTSKHGFTHKRRDLLIDFSLTVKAATFIFTRNGPAQARVMMKSVLSSAEHGRCPHKYQNWEQLLAFQYLRVG